MLRADGDVAAGLQIRVCAGQRAPKRNGWTIAQHAGDRSPDRTQRLLNRASWDTLAAMSEVRRFGAGGLAEAARRAAGGAAW